MDANEFADRYASMMKSVEVTPDLKERAVAYALENFKQSDLKPTEQAGGENAGKSSIKSY